MLYFGDNTDAAVRKFQQDNNLSVDGVAGQKTKTALYNIITTGSSNSTTGTAFSLNKLSASGTAAGTSISGSSASGTGSSTPSSGVSYTTSNLSKSMAGVYSKEVKKLQEDLVSLGYGVNGIDGYFGNSTEVAVRKFQQDHNLTVDGVAGQNTKNAIINEIASTTGRKLGNNGVPVDIMNKINTGSTGYSTPSTATSYTQSNLSKSMVNTYNSEVKKLQEDLVSIGYGVNGIDGYFGTNTEEAVKKFQKANGLVVDGIAGSITKNAIAKEVASMAGRQSGNNGVPVDIINKKSEPEISYTQSNLSKSMVNVYNSEVEKLQKDLTSLKYSTNGIDGYFGNNTEKAVRKFQQDHKLKVDGIAGKDTKLAISNALHTGPVQGPIKIEENQFSKERIVISGDFEASGDYVARSFIETAIKQIKEWKLKDDGEITWAVVKAGYSDKDIELIKEAAKNDGVSLMFIDGSKQLFDYINNGKNRDEIKITDVSIFSHGLRDDNGTLALDYNGSDDMNITAKEIKESNINKNAFSNVHTFFGSCNSGTIQNDTSFAIEWVKKTGGEAIAVCDPTPESPTDNPGGQTSYKDINEGKGTAWDLGDKYRRNVLKENFDINGAENYPTLGKDTNNKDIYWVRVNEDGKVEKIEKGGPR